MAAIKEDEDAALRRVMAGRASPCSGEGAIIALGKDSVGAVGHLETVTRSVDVGELACPPPGTDHTETVDLCGLAAVGFPVIAGGAPRGPSPVLDEGPTDRKVGRDLRLSASRTYPQLASLCTEGGVYMGMGDVPDIPRVGKTPFELQPHSVRGEVPAGEPADDSVTFVGGWLGSWGLVDGALLAQLALLSILELG